MIRADVLGELARFTAVGVLGFVVDASVLYTGLRLGLGLYLGRLLSYIAAASFTWICNRSFTFRSPAQPSIAEWLRFLAANGVGGLTNLAIYGALVASLAVVATHPVLAVAAGSLAGLLLNFGVSRYTVFRRA